MTEEEIEKIPIWNQRLKRHLPVLTWLPKYRKSDLVADTIAGITLGLTLVPQSIAYAALAGVSAEYGLYSSFMGGFVYFFFGTVKEVSVGPTSLVSLLTFEFTRDLPLEFVFLFTFLCGAIEFLLGLFQFGFLVNFIPMPVTTSFQTATSLIIIVSQLKDFFGVPKFKSGRFLYNIYSVAERIPEACWGDIVLSLCCCAFLLSLRQLNSLKMMKAKKVITKKEKILKKVLWAISISRNALCVFLSCIVAYGFMKNGDPPPFKITGDVPSGLPTFRPPAFSTQIENRTLTFGEMIYEISPGLFVVPLICILANVTIAKAFCAAASVDATQEMITLGLCNMGGSFFGSVPTCGAFTRSAVSNSSGVRTPLSGLFTGTLIILVIKYLTPYFYYIPRATLASVLICAVIFMVDLKTIFLLWRANKRDFVYACVTFVASLVVGVQIGLGLGILFSIGHLLYMWARPSVHVEVNETTTGSYYLVRPDIGLFFPSNDFIRKEIIDRCPRNIPIVIDCSHLKGVDYTSAQGIKDLASYYRKTNRNLGFINMTLDMYSVLKNSKVEINLKQYVSDEEENEELKVLLFGSENPEVPFAILIDRRHSGDKDSIKNKTDGKALIHDPGES